MPALSGNVYESIKALLMDHAIAPGAKITIDGLARDLEVSQTPVREALAALEADGLTVKEFNRSYRATAVITREEFEDLFALRFQLEPWATALAARLAPDEQVAELGRCLAEVPPAPMEASYDEYRALTMHDQRFHHLVHVASGNTALSPAFERLHVHLQIFRLYYGSGIGTHAVREHESIYAAIRMRDPAAARAAMKAHLIASRNRLRPAFATGAAHRSTAATPELVRARRRQPASTPTSSISHTGKGISS
jgi:DNA-binding GntR family transcriptional regulator